MAKASCCNNRGRYNQEIIPGSAAAAAASANRRITTMFCCRAGRALFAAAVLFFLGSSIASAGEKSLMHCFTFTVIDDASEADWAAFKKATDALPSKIDGLEKVWYGKLRNPLTQYSQSGDKSVRQWGVCMQMNDLAALKTYADHPAHAEWASAYGKVRVAGTTTFDILGE
jgi:hypothetical protein